MLLYALMYQLQTSLNVRSFVTRECLDFMKMVFTEESVTLKSIEDEFCDYEKIQWSYYKEHIK